MQENITKHGEAQTMQTPKNKVPPPRSLLDEWIKLGLITNEQADELSKKII